MVLFVQLIKPTNPFCWLLLIEILNLINEAKALISHQKVNKDRLKNLDIGGKLATTKFRDQESRDYSWLHKWSYLWRRIGIFKNFINPNYTFVVTVMVSYIAYTNTKGKFVRKLFVFPHIEKLNMRKIRKHDL